MVLSSSRSPLSRTELLTLSSRDPGIEELLQTSGRWPDPPFTDIPQCRSLSDYADNLLSNAHGPPPDGLVEDTISIPTCDTYTSQATLTRPSTSRPPGPLVILFHPGGFFLGSPAKMNTYARALATLFGASVLCPSYRFAPEHPFPTGIKDAWAVVQWAASHAEGLSADPVSQGFLLGGVSSGANFAVALTRHAVEAGLHPRVTGVWAPLFIGCVSPEHVPDRYGEVYVSHEQNADALVIDKGKAATMWEYYKPENASPLFNPLAVGAGLAFDLGRMPKVCLQVAGQDLFRDDGLVLGYALRDAGAQVRVDVYPGVPHSFWVFAPSVEVSRECIRDMVEGFAWLLGVAIEDLPQGWEVAMVAPSIKLDDKV